MDYPLCNLYSVAFPTWSTGIAPERDYVRAVSPRGLGKLSRFAGKGPRERSFVRG